MSVGMHVSYLLLWWMFLPSPQGVDQGALILHEATLHFRWSSHYHHDNARIDATLTLQAVNKSTDDALKFVTLIVVQPSHTCSYPYSPVPRYVPRAAAVVIVGGYRRPDIAVRVELYRHHRPRTTYVTPAARQTKEAFSTTMPMAMARPRV